MYRIIPTMATKKTTTTKKTTKPASSAARAKTSTKKNTAVRKSTSKNRSAQMQSFRVASERQKFMSFNLTIQTFYWVVLGVIVIMFTAWIMKLQADVNSIYDQIDLNQSVVIEEPQTLQN